MMPFKVLPLKISKTFGHPFKGDKVYRRSNSAFKCDSFVVSNKGVKANG
jgi:hypothetical protein